MADLVKKFTTDGALLTVEFLHALASENFANTVVSPLSLQCCMALAFAGATGETAEEIAAGLKYVSKVPAEIAETFQTFLQQCKGGPFIKLGNKIYVKSGLELKDEYKKEVEKFYRGEIEVIQFDDNAGATAIMNEWVSRTTNAKIPEIITSENLDKCTSAILLSAIHFKGQWRHKFSEANTAEDDFWYSQKQSVKMKYMNQRGRFRYRECADLQCTMLEMPYKDTDLRMVIMLPNEREGLKEMLVEAIQVNLLEIAGSMRKDYIMVKIPKFKLQCSYEMSSLLKKFGINRIFTDEAEFSKMADTTEPFSVSKIYHKVSVEVNEEGTEAGAASSVTFTARTAGLKFSADHPFMYFIWNRHYIYFAGIHVHNVKKKISFQQGTF